MRTHLLVERSHSCPCKPPSPGRYGPTHFPNPILGVRRTESTPVFSDPPPSGRSTEFWPPTTAGAQIPSFGYTPAVVRRVHSPELLEDPMYRASGSPYTPSHLGTPSRRRDPSPYHPTRATRATNMPFLPEALGSRDRAPRPTRMQPRKHIPPPGQLLFRCSARLPRGPRQDARPSVSASVLRRFAAKGCMLTSDGPLRV